MPTTATPWVGNWAGGKLYLQSGQFTSTIKTSENINAVETLPVGIDWDGTNTPYIGSQADQLYLQSGQFTSTLKTSQSISAKSTSPSGISSDSDSNTPWSTDLGETLYLTSGQFSSTIKSSLTVSGIYVKDISFDSAHTPWADTSNDKLKVQSGQFTATLKTSLDISAVDISINGISWDNTNTPWCGSAGIKLYLQSGQFTSTIKDSQTLSGIAYPEGISTDDFVGRTGGAAIQKSVSDTLVFTEDVDETRISPPLVTQVLNEALTFLEVVEYDAGDPDLLDTLVFAEAVAVTTNNFRIADVLVFAEVARQPITYINEISDTLTFVDSTTYATNNYSGSDQIIFEEHADLRGTYSRIGRDIIDQLVFTDSTTVLTFFYAFHITDTLTFVESVVRTHPYNLDVSDELVFDEVLAIRQPYNKEVTSYMYWTYRSDGYPHTLGVSFEEDVTRQWIMTRRGNESLVFVENVGVVNIKAGATSESVSDTLIFTEDASRVYGGIDTLVFAETISVDQCYAGKDILIFTETLTYSQRSSYDMSDTLTFESTVAFNRITSDIYCQYSPFIGKTTVSDAPNPPHQVPRTIVRYDHVQLFYPTDNPTSTVNLRGPEFEDRDQLHFARISRETRGGTLVVYADPMWPQNQRLLLSFIGLSETDAQAALTFVEATIGKEIGLRDWEGQEWRGVILTPENPITRNHTCNLGFDIEFEGGPVSRHSESDTLTFTEDYGLIKI